MNSKYPPLFFVVAIAAATLLCSKILIAQNSDAITASQYASFLNETAKADPDSLYEAKMDSDAMAVRIIRSGSPGAYFYSVEGVNENAPIAYIDYFSALRYCAWKNSSSSLCIASLHGEIDLSLRSGCANFYLLSTSTTQQSSSKERSWESTAAEIGSVLLFTIVAYRSCSAHNPESMDGIRNQAALRENPLTVTETDTDSSTAVRAFDGKKLTRTESFLSPDRDVAIAAFRAKNASLSQATETHTTALTKAIKAVDRRYLPRWKPSRSLNQLMSAKELLEQAATEASTVAAALGYSNSEALQNHYHYSEEQVVLGGATFSKSGTFTFGPELKQQLEASTTGYVLNQLQHPDQKFLFEEVKKDLRRAIFTTKESDRREELLYDRSKPPTEENSLDGSITKLQSFIGENKALQIAVTSLLYQRGTADLELMNNAASRGTTEEGEALDAFFTDGLHSVSTLSFPESSTPRKNKPETKTTWYALDKEPADTSAVLPRERFMLTITHSCVDERSDTTSPQEFVRHQGASVVYTFEANPFFCSEQPLSLENLPVIVHCIDGHLSHAIAPYEAPLDMLASDLLHRLEPDQQATVTAYQNAQQEYKIARVTYQQKLNTLAGRPLRNPFLTFSEKSAAEQTLQAAQNNLTRAIQAMRSSTTTARFLEENTANYSPEKISFQHHDQTVTCPANGCFVGGKELQGEVTEETHHALSVVFNDPQKDSYTSLQADLENGNYSFVLQASDQEPVALSEATGIKKLQAFVGYENLTKTISTIMNKDALVAEIQIVNTMPRYQNVANEEPRPPFSAEGLQGPKDSDLLSEGIAPPDHTTFLLEKRIPIAAEDLDLEESSTPYFALTITHQLGRELSAGAKEEDGSVHYNRVARFVYTFKKNDDFDHGELLSPQNLPVDVRCTGVRIDYTLEHGF